MKPFDKFVLFALALLVLAIVVVVTVVEHQSRAAILSGSPKRITFEAPTPTAVEVFWIDSAGNLGLRGVEAIVPGLPSSDPKGAQISPACRASATANGAGTLTVCMNAAVGQTLGQKLGLDMERHP